jgi:hypothetical protein
LHFRRRAAGIKKHSAGGTASQHTFPGTPARRAFQLKGHQKWERSKNPGKRSENLWQACCTAFAPDASRSKVKESGEKAYRRGRERGCSGGKMNVFGIAFSYRPNVLRIQSRSTKKNSDSYLISVWFLPATCLVSDSNTTATKLVLTFCAQHDYTAICQLPDAYQISVWYPIANWFLSEIR